MAVAVGSHQISATMSVLLTASGLRLHWLAKRQNILHSEFRYILPPKERSNPASRLADQLRLIQSPVSHRWLDSASVVRVYLCVDSCHSSPVPITHVECCTSSPRVDVYSLHGSYCGNPELEQLQQLHSHLLTTWARPAIAP